MSVVGRPAGVLDRRRLRDAADGRVVRHRQLQVRRGSKAPAHADPNRGRFSCHQLRPVTVARRRIHSGYEAADLDPSLRWSHQKRGLSF